MKKSSVLSMYRELGKSFAKHGKSKKGHKFILQKNVK
jgi:hypothetical protein